MKERKYWITPTKLSNKKVSLIASVPYTTLKSLLEFCMNKGIDKNDFVNQAVLTALDSKPLLFKPKIIRRELTIRKPEIKKRPITVRKKPMLKKRRITLTKRKLTNRD